MYIDIVPNRTSQPAILLRESVRDGKRVRKRTIANLSSLPIEQVEAIRRVLKGEKLAPAGGGLDCIRSQPHGHVEAVRTAMRRLGFDKLIDAKTSRERDLVVAMVAGRHHRAGGEQARHDACLVGHDAGGGSRRRRCA